jgi:hypothetical protein
MKTRLSLAFVFLLATAVALGMVYLGRFSSETTGILSNVGTEFVGIAATVLIIDWMYELRASRSESRSVALSVLQELDHALWVWQGDRRGFDLDELYTRASGASQEDPFPPYTQNLFMRLGSRCVSHLGLKIDSIGSSADLVHALRELARLESIRDADRDYTFQDFKALLLVSIERLALVCGLPRPKLIALQPTAHSLSSEEHQHYRHFGRQVDGSHQPIWGLPPEP